MPRGVGVRVPLSALFSSPLYEDFFIAGNVLRVSERAAKKNGRGDLLHEIASAVFLFFALLFDWNERHFVLAADRTNPLVRQAVERSTRFDSVFGVAQHGVVNVVANFASVLFHINLIY